MGFRLIQPLTETVPGIFLEVVKADGALGRQPYHLHVRLLEILEASNF